MCALCVGDIHGNYLKAKSFLEYKPEEEHIFVGDYTDSFHAADKEIIKTMNLIFESNAIVLSGNHDNQYFKNAGMFTRCSGYRAGSAIEYINLIEKYKDKIKASYVVDDFFVVHGGIHNNFCKNVDTIYELNDYCNKEFEDFKNSPIVQSMYSNIFKIGPNRGGYDNYSGVFWATFGFDEFDERFNIICGHTHRSEVGIYHTNQNKLHVCVDCPQFVCFNTSTKQIEDFMPEELKEDRYKYEKIF